MSEEMNYQQAPGASQSEERLQQLQENNLTTTQAEMDSQKERVMFERYVQENGEAIPSNFKTAGDWFDSLKTAQKNYTQGQQEIAALKQQYNEGGVVNPNYQEQQPVVEQEQQPAVESTGKEELRIELKEDPPAPDPAAVLNQQRWEEWGKELSSTGAFTEQTTLDIMNTTGFTQEMVNDYVAGQKARMRESYNEAASIVGGKDRMDQIFKWAETNLSKDEQMTINQGLAGDSYEITLRGLASLYDGREVATVKNQEPSAPQNLQSVAASETGFVGYKTKREFMADRNNPRFKLEPQFREAVEQRMQRTDFNTLPA